jgi:adenylate cyclase
MPTYTATQLAEAAGLSERATRRFFRALGFPDSGDEVGYTEEDLRVVVALHEAVAGSDVDLATAVRLVRAVGQNVARMADWQVAALASRSEQLREERGPGGSGGPGGSASGAARRDAAQHIADEMDQAMQQVLLHAWRRHVAAALTRLEVDPEDEYAQTALVTVGFADLVNFSALSNEMDSNRLGELVEIFESRCGDVVAAHEGRMIKTLGDSVLFVADEAERAMEIAEGLIDVIGGDKRLPDVRLGLATGLVITRLGDVFGPPVNLAARLTALARRNRVIVDEATVEVLRPAAYEVRRLTARPVRGFGLVEPVAIRRR